jgi:hypothetical protein
MHERALARADPRLRISGDSGGGGGGGAFGCVAIISAWPEELDEGEDRQRDDDAEPEVELAFDPNEPLFNLGEAVFGWGETVKIDAAHGFASAVWRRASERSTYFLMTVILPSFSKIAARTLRSRADVVARAQRLLIATSRREGRNVTMPP